MIFTQVIANPESIIIKSQKKIENLPMGDLVINDPAGRKIVIPFRVIYNFLINRPSYDLKTGPAYYNNKAGMCIIKKAGQKITYLFKYNKLKTVELFSQQSNSRAIATVSNSEFPPVKLSAKIVDISMNKQKDLVSLIRKRYKKRKLDKKYFSF